MEEDRSSMSTTNDIDESEILDPEGNGVEGDEFTYEDFSENNSYLENLPFRAISFEQTLKYIEQSIKEHEILINQMIYSTYPHLKNNLTLDQCLYLLQKNDWNLSYIYKDLERSMSHTNEVGLNNLSTNTTFTTNIKGICTVCLSNHISTYSSMALFCGHIFCFDCWKNYIKEKLNLLKDDTIINTLPNSKILHNTSTFENLEFKPYRPWDLRCMEYKCHQIIPREFVNQLLSSTQGGTNEASPLLLAYNQALYNDIIRVHPQLGKCPNSHCDRYFYSAHASPKKVTCPGCHAEFCFLCQREFHAPTSCKMIHKWHAKCSDDSETSNYIRANTKDCPKCAVCIEKNGGCNHMKCFKCYHEFCWMCLEAWANHGSGYYECARYEEKQTMLPADESRQKSDNFTFSRANSSSPKYQNYVQKSREALNRYLFHFSRWENHGKSRKWEEENIKKNFHAKMYNKILAKEGTWIDWEYLNEGADLLSKCRHTLQYAYPHAYFADPGPEKDIFQTQHAQLEVELENLSWKLEKAEITDRADLENQMNVVSKRRYALLKPFFEAYESEGSSSCCSRSRINFIHH